MASLALSGALFLPWLALFVDQATGALRPWAVPNTKGIDLFAVLKLPLGPPSLGLSVLGLLGAGLALGRPRSGGPQLASPEAASPGLVPSELVPSELARAELASPGLGSRAGRVGVIVLLAGALGGNVLAWCAQFLPWRARLEPQYLIGMAVWTLPVVCFGWMALGRRLRSPVQRSVAAALLAASVLACAAVDAPHWLRPRSPAPQVARWIEQRERPGDLVLVLPAPLAITFSFYYRGSAARWAPPFREPFTRLPWSELTRRLGDRALAAEIARDLERHLLAGRRLWVVAGSGIGPEPEGESGLETGAGSGTVEALARRIATAETEYERALLEGARELLAVAERSAGPGVRQDVTPAGAQRSYWEPMSLWLYQGAAP